MSVEPTCDFCGASGETESAPTPDTRFAFALRHPDGSYRGNSSYYTSLDHARLFSRRADAESVWRVEDGAEVVTFKMIEEI